MSRICFLIWIVYNDMYLIIGLIESDSNKWNLIQHFVILPRNIMNHSTRYLSYNWSIWECEKIRLLCDELSTNHSMFRKIITKNVPLQTTSDVST